jgi:hypothetical protein
MSGQNSAVADPGPGEESKVSARDSAAQSGARRLVEASVFEDARLQSRLHAADGASGHKAAPISETSAPATLLEAARALMNV